VHSAGSKHGKSPYERGSHDAAARTALKASWSEREERIRFQEAEIARLRGALHLIAEGHIAPKTLATLTLDGPDSPVRARPERERA
jgi:hypothetical protein